MASRFDKRKAFIKFAKDEQFKPYLYEAAYDNGYRNHTKLELLLLTYEAKESGDTSDLRAYQGKLKEDFDELLAAGPEYGESIFSGLVDGFAHEAALTALTQTSGEIFSIIAEIESGNYEVAEAFAHGFLFDSHATSQATALILLSISGGNALVSRGVGLGKAVPNRTVNVDDVSFGRNPNQEYHTWRHIDDIGMDRTTVQNSILDDIPADLPAGPHRRTITVDNTQIEYRIFKFDDGTFNVGSIFDK